MLFHLNYFPCAVTSVIHPCLGLEPEHVGAMTGLDTWVGATGLHAFPLVNRPTFPLGGEAGEVIVLRVFMDHSRQEGKDKRRASSSSPHHYRPTPDLKASLPPITIDYAALA